MWKGQRPKAPKPLGAGAMLYRKRSRHQKFTVKSKLQKSSEKGLN